MKQLKYILIGVGLVLGLASCEMRDELKNESNELQDNEGVVAFNFETKDGVNEITTSRSGFDANEVNPDLYTVQIIDLTTESIKKECTFNELKQEGGKIKLSAGRYRVLAFNYNGFDVEASERPFFLGKTDFQVLAGKTTKVHTVCRLQNIELKLQLATSFIEKFKDDYSISFTNNDKAVYIYNKENHSKKTYFKVPENVTSLLMTVKATTKTNVQIIQSYTISKPTNAETNPILTAGDSFTITVNPGDEPSVDPTTKIDLGISVDLTMIETGVTIDIPTDNIVFNGDDGEDPGDGEEESKGPILIEGLNKTYSYVAMSDDAPTIKVSFSVPNKIQKLLVKINSNNESFLNILSGLGLGEEFDLANPGELLQVLEGDLSSGEGIGLLKPGEVILGETEYLFDISHFVPLLGLFGESESTFTITVSDGVNENETGVLTIQVKPAAEE